MYVQRNKIEVKNKHKELNIKILFYVRSSMSKPVQSVLVDGGVLILF